jgi:hypothetical protein
MSWRARLLVAACLVAGLGCGSDAAPPLSAAPPTTWSLILESATVADPGIGVAPAVYVDATVGGETFESLSATTTPDNAGGFNASWGTPLFAGDEVSLQAGIDLQVWADLGNGAELAGEILYRPTLADFGAGVIELGTFKDVTNLTVELTPN